MHTLDISIILITFSLGKQLIVVSIAGNAILCFQLMESGLIVLKGKCPFVPTEWTELQLRVLFRNSVATSDSIVNQQLDTVVRRLTFQLVQVELPPQHLVSTAGVT